MTDELEALMPVFEAALPGYAVSSVIGRGAFGTVYGGVHRQLGRRVAVKLLRAETNEGNLRERFFQEAWVAASLVDAHIVPVYDYVEYDGRCLIVMEYLSQGTLRQRSHTEGLLPDESCAITIATLTGLAHAHAKNCVHRDIKPDNILFGDQGAVKLADFGIARLLTSAGRHTNVGELIGTPTYLSPEQATGQEVGPPSDLYSTGVVLYELLSGRRPYGSGKDALAALYSHVHDAPIPLRDVSPEMPSGLIGVVERALEKSPADRYASAEAFATDLARAANAAFGPRWLRDVAFTVKPANDVFAAANATAGSTDPQERASRPFRETVVVADIDALERTKRGSPRLMTTEAYRQRSMLPLVSAPQSLATTFDPTPPPAPDLGSRVPALPAWATSAGSASVSSQPTRRVGLVIAGAIVVLLVLALVAAVVAGVF